MSIDFSDDSREYRPAENIMTTSATPEDDGEYSLRPKTLKEYIGQEKAKKNLAVFIEGAKRRNEPLDHVILHGPPGLGKTTLAAIIANEMGVSLRKTSGPAIEKPKDLAALLTNLNENDILFIDEIHRMNRSIAVSYTHLDVYKRQLYYPARSMLSAGILKSSLSRLPQIGRNVHWRPCL